MKNFLKYTIIGAVLILNSSCEKTLDIYLGIPFKPKNINSVYEPGLNVFGILKAGPTFDTLNHFFEVQRLVHLSDTSSTYVDEATITLEQIKNDNSHLLFQLTNYRNGNYAAHNINPDFGETWFYTCAYDTFLVESSTRIPNQPILKDGGFICTDKSLSVTILPDSSAFLYEAYFLNTNDYAFDRITPDNNAETKINLTFTSKDKDGANYLFVFAYDKNFKNYISTSNIFYKPNAFRPRYTTVEGGYGCFCSASSIVIQF